MSRTGPLLFDDDKDADRWRTVTRMSAAAWTCWVTVNCVCTAFWCSPRPASVVFGRPWKIVIRHLIVYWQDSRSASLGCRVTSVADVADVLPKPKPKTFRSDPDCPFTALDSAELKCLITSSIRASTRPTAQHERTPIRTSASHVISSTYGQQFRPIANNALLTLPISLSLLCVHEISI